MSTPILWIVGPLVVSGGFLLLMRKRYILKWIGTGISMILAASALILPINQMFTFLFWEIRINDELLVFGRKFVLSNPSRPVIALVFLTCFLWFLIMDPVTLPIQVIPLGFTGSVLIITAYAVAPIFYGALFFAFIALIYVILLSPPGTKPTPGALRFLIFQILGVLFILFASWLASWIDLTTGEELLYRSLVILSLGFSFLLGIFPFTSWIPMVAEKNHPFLVGFVYNSYLLGVILFGTRFLTEGGWFTQGINLQGPLQAAGALMLGVGGILAIFSSHLGRLMGAVMIAEIGKSLLAVSLFISGFPLYFGMVVVQGLALAVWAVSVSHLGRVLLDLRYESAAGAARQWPGITSGFLFGYFALAGLPFLAGFPFYWALGTGLSLYPAWINSWFILGIIGLLVGGIRALGALTLDSGEEDVLLLGNQFQQSMIYIINGVLVILGLYPQGLMRIGQAISIFILGG